MTDEDRCYFLGEYTAREGYRYSATNDLILNFKKTPDRRGWPEWRYKEAAIQEAAAAFRQALGSRLPSTTFVPVPPSKVRSDPLHDDRLIRMLHAIWPEKGADIRDLLVLSQSAGTAHAGPDRPTPQQLEAAYRIDEALATPEPRSFAVVDDVLTTGAHYRAVSSLLSGRFPGARPVGLFIARRAPGGDAPP